MAYSRTINDAPALSDDSVKPFHADILRALLYYDIWKYPLTAQELFTFLPTPSPSFESFLDNLRTNGAGGDVAVADNFYFVRARTPVIVAERRKKERHAERLWLAARISMHFIKRFPFVRGIFISGDLSKNATHRQSDVDFFIITEPNRLWIARTLLILFKKIFLLNRKKYFCLNSFAASNRLALDNRNIYLAAEVAHLKPLFNSELFCKYLEANGWVRSYFPNFTTRFLKLPRTDNRPSSIQRALELPFSWIPADRLDSFLLRRMKTVWANRYPQYDEETRERIFRCSKYESRAYVGNFEEKVLSLYEKKLKEFGLNDGGDHE